MKPKASKAARRAAKRIRNTKAELLDTITSQHKAILDLERQAFSLRGTILRITETIAQITDADELRVLRLKMILLLRRQLEQRLREAIEDVFAFFERPRPSGYVHREMAKIVAIRELARKA